ncbi:hypothetical protein COLO4_10634 [Corchorus olitorius]|uniref:TIR domain-containing protein n=1 Tax=Corchorus olitorius TaxID=93759 RepID=A0A1R3K7M2_9ROSI|nr:hypothetical protein COLO4_10634 [Corchorus olitorius]
MNAIAASKISIPIFSKDYASSKSCLAELSQIIGCMRSQGQIVLPIFYHVDPSDVRHHSGSFKESFDQHLMKKPKEQVERWKAAFTQAGQLKGWHIVGGNFDSKIIITSRDRQVLKNIGVNELHEDISLLTTWAIWYNRNMELHETIRRTPGETVQFIKAYLSEFQRVNKRLLQHQHWYLENLLKDGGTESIKGISLDISDVESALQIGPTIFKKMDNLTFIQFNVGELAQFYLDDHEELRNRLLLANGDLAYLPDELRYFHWAYCPLKALPSNFSPNNLAELNLHGLNIEQLWNENLDVAVNSRRMYLSDCMKLRKIPNLLGAVKLETLDCVGNSSKLGRNRFVWDSNRRGALLYWVYKEIAKIKDGGTKIQKVPSSILKLEELEHLILYDCPKLTELNLGMTCDLEEVPSSVSGLQKGLRELNVRGCKSLKSLSMLPSSLQLYAHGCTSLERVLFVDQGEHHSSADANFSYCFNLNRDACNNIVEAYPMTQIQSIAKKSAKKLTKNRQLISKVCSNFPGCEIPDKFGNQSKNSSITVKLDSTTNTRKFLCFALSFVVDFDHFFKEKVDSYGNHIQVEYQLKGTDGSSQNFKREWDFHWEGGPIPVGCYDEHVFVLFRTDMVHRDMNYKETSFDFCLFGKNKTERVKEMKVEKCGVHVF